MPHQWDYYDSNHALSAHARIGKFTFLARDDGEASAADQVKSVDSDRLLALLTWTPARQVWNYWAANTIQAAGDLTFVNQKGQKLRLVQSSTTKYFYITAASYNSGGGYTLLTINGGSDYTLVNSAITEVYYSNAGVAPGFPQVFNYACTPTGFSAVPTLSNYRFCIRGGLVRVEFAQLAPGTSNATTFTIPLPITAATIANMAWYGNLSQSSDNSSLLSAAGVMYVLSAGTAIQLFTTRGGGVWTASGTKSAGGDIEYEY